MKAKIECDLDGCKKVFVPRAAQQRFCSKKHHDRYHQLERAMLIRIAKAMGIRK
jgi:hypothetical protein